jgi:hypothetical protein
MKKTKDVLIEESMLSNTKDRFAGADIEDYRRIFSRVFADEIKEIELRQNLQQIDKLIHQLIEKKEWVIREYLREQRRKK